MARVIAGFEDSFRFVRKLNGRFAKGMNLTPTLRRIWDFFSRRQLTVGPIIIGLLLTALMAERVRASCGDYVRTSSHSGRQAVLLTTDPPVDLRVRVPLSLPSPCNGPMCRRQLPGPQPSWPTTNRTRIDEFAVRVAESERAFPEVTTSRELVSHGPSDGYPSSIKRPPRS